MESQPCTTSVVDGTECSHPSIARAHRVARRDRDKMESLVGRGSNVRLQLRDFTWLHHGRGDGEHREDGCEHEQHEVDGDPNTPHAHTGWACSHNRALEPTRVTKIQTPFTRILTNQRASLSKCVRTLVMTLNNSKFLIN